MEKHVFIVDSHPVMVRGYASLLSAASGFSICGTARAATDALERVPEVAPDLVISEISLGGLSGLEFIKRLGVKDNNWKVLVVSKHSERLFAERALQAGARGYVMKTKPCRVLMSAIRSVVGGGFYFSDSIRNVLVQQYTGRANDTSVRLSELADRELEVFEHMGRGRSTHQIADAMDISIKTVETYRRRIKDKMSIAKTEELRRRATLWVEHS